MFFINKVREIFHRQFGEHNLSNIEAAKNMFITW